MRWLAALFIFISGAVAAQDNPVEDLNDLIDQSNFIVGSGRGHCSGTLISLEHRLILTNNHCIASSVRRVDRERSEGGIVQKKRVEVRDDVPVQQKFYESGKEAGRASYQAAILAYDEDRDLALLQIKTKTIPNGRAMRVFGGDQGDLLRGSGVYTIGNPLMLDASVMRGVVASVNRVFTRKSGGDLALIQTDAGIAPGSSGGAMVNDRLALIGVPAMAARGTQVGLAVAFWDIQTFLTGACFEEVWNPAAQAHDDCMAARDPEDKPPIEDLLRELVKRRE